MKTKIIAIFYDQDNEERDRKLAGYINSPSPEILSQISKWLKNNPRGKISYIVI